jgi:peptidoglycan/LPS O-acetylase OafA/YrhL
MLDPKYALSALSIDYGPASVLIFFVLSGYVIGLTVRGVATPRAIGHYLQRRALRIVPITWVAIFLSVILYHASGKALIGNLLFLQNTIPYPFGFRLPLLPNNPPLWSLSYEMLYYLLFIAIWRFSPKVWVVYCVTLILAFGRPLSIPPIIASQASGMLFWLSGLSIAWFSKVEQGPKDTPWLAAIIGVLAFWTIGPFKVVTLVFFHRFATPGMLSLGRLDFCLGATLIVMTVTNRAKWLQRRMAISILILCAGILPLKLYEAMLTTSDVWALGFVALASIFWKWRPSIIVLVWLAPVGAFSFALYAIHFPIALAVRDALSFLPSDGGYFVVRSAVFGVVTLAFAWFLERRVQSWLSKRLKPSLDKN